MLLHCLMAKDLHKKHSKQQQKLFITINIKLKWLTQRHYWQSPSSPAHSRLILIWNWDPNTPLKMCFVLFPDRGILGNLHTRDWVEWRVDETTSKTNSQAHKMIAKWHQPLRPRLANKAKLKCEEQQPDCDYILRLSSALALALAKASKLSKNVALIIPPNDDRLCG